MKKIYATIFVLLLSVTTFAHEYWIEPENFFPAQDEKTVVHLYVGDGLIKDREERPFQLAKTPLFQLFSMEKTWDLKTSLKDEAMPIYHFSAEKAGNYLLAMERNWSYIKLEPNKFEDYLREDGMEYIIAEREKLGERAKEGRERYSRFIKSLLQVGKENDYSFNKNVGLKLEIVPLENPYSKKIGDKLKFQILFDGKPLTRKAVFVDNNSGLGVRTQKFTTSKNGSISFKISRDGFWLVRLVFMQRCKSDCAEADWESFWGAFSFGVR